MIVPGLGGFMAHHVDARFDETENIFLPPLRTIGFNPRLTMNDSLLVQSYIEAYDISYPEALRRIEAEVAEIKQHLETENQYELNDLGILRFNDEGNMEFAPCEAGILTPNFYGLSSYEMMPIAVEEVGMSILDETETPDKITDGAITIKMSWLRNAVAAAAAVVAFFMISTPISNNSTMQDVQQSAFLPLPQHHALQDKEQAPANTDTTDTAFCQNKDIQTDKTDNIVKESVAEPTYTIVLASQVTQYNAEIFISQLKKADFTDAKLQTSSKTNMLRVIYGCYNSQDEAVDSLRSLRKQNKHFSEAWVMEIK